MMMHLPTRDRLFIASLLATAISMPGLRAQTPGPGGSAVIQVEAREVVVDVTVTGAKASPASGLTAKDFSVWEDGKAQKIVSVSSASADSETLQKHFVLYLDFDSMPIGNQRAS